MKKIIQIFATVDEMFCLTEDGKVYERQIKDRKVVEDGRKTYSTGTYYWREMPEEDKF